jgi:hypothetical protein
MSAWAILLGWFSFAIVLAWLFGRPFRITPRRARGFPLFVVRDDNVEHPRTSAEEAGDTGKQSLHSLQDRQAPAAVSPGKYRETTVAPTAPIHVRHRRLL